MLVTISGLPGSGKTTVARLLSRRLRLPHVYAGDIYRQEARERGLALEELNRLAARDHSIDRALDARMAAYARAGDVVLEGRLAGFVAREQGVEGLRVWLTASDEVRAARVAQREGKESAPVRRQNEERQRSDAQRYREIYGWDLDDTSIYHLILDTDREEPERVAARIIAAAAASGSRGGRGSRACT